MSGLSFRSDGVVAKSLKMTRATSVLVAALTAGISVNAMVAMQFVGGVAQAVLAGIVFGTLVISTSAVAADVFARSEQSIANLRSIGATLKSMTGAILGAVILWGVAGAILGTGAGSAIGTVSGGSSATAVSVLVEGSVVILLSVAAMSAGVYLGARRSWRS